MITITIDRSTITPSSVDNGTRARYKDLGPRRECYTCESADACPVCANDSVVRRPVVPGDVLYLQTLFPDQFNLNPENPLYGFYLGDDNYLIKAIIEYSESPELVVLDQPFVLAAGVGYFERSYQNITLDSLGVLMNGNGCFRVRFETQILQSQPKVTAVVGIGPLPDYRDYRMNELWAYGNHIYKVGLTGWVALTDPVEIGDVVLLLTDAKYYQYNGTNYVDYEMILDTVPGPTCWTEWFEQAICEETIMLEGYHPAGSCDGSIYEPINTESQYHPGYRDQYRVWAAIEKTSYPTERTEEDGQLTKFILHEQYLIRATRGWSDKIAGKVARTLVGLHVYIDSLEYDSFSNVERNNEEGYDWYPQITCSRMLCQTQDCYGVATFPNPNAEECPDCGDSGGTSTVRNSTGSYTETVACGDTLDLPNILVTQADGSVSGAPAVESVVCEFPDIQLQDSDGTTKHLISAYPSGGLFELNDSVAKSTTGVVVGTAPYGDDIVVPDVSVTQINGATTSSPVNLPVTCVFPGLSLRDTLGNLLNSYSSYPTLGNVIAPNVVVNRDGSFYANAPAGSTINVPSVGITPSGILYNRPICTQKTQFRTGDTGWHCANGTFNWSTPANPAVIQELDYSATEWFFTLKYNNVHGNKFRFTNSVGSEALDGKLNFTGAKTYTTGGGLAFYVVDHYTGLGFYVANLGNVGVWNNSIDAAHAQRAGALLGFTNWFPWFREVYELCQYRFAGTGGTESLMKAGIVSGHTESFSWLADTNLTSTTQAFYYRQGGDFTSILKTSGSVTTGYVCRAHF